MKRVPVSTRVIPSDYAALQKIASDRGDSLSDVVNEAIARYLGRAGAGTRARARMDRMEDQIQSLTLLVAGGAGGDRAAMAQQFLDAFNRQQ
jgi:hypothetical protein